MTRTSHKIKQLSIFISQMMYLLTIKDFTYFISNSDISDTERNTQLVLGIPFVIQAIIIFSYLKKENEYQ